MDPLHSRRSRRAVFLAVFVAISLVTVPIAGGRIERLARIRLRWKPVIFGALAIQVVIVTLLPGGDPGLHRVLHLVSYAMAAAFLVANRRTAGMAMIAFGALGNVTAIVANNGVMPASAAALRAAGEMPTTSGFLNSGLLAHPHLLFLGDVFSIPQWVPLNNVFSVGDVLIALGAAVTIHTYSGSKLLAWRTRTREVVSDDQASPLLPTS
jgi:hypothetical protein